MANLDLAEPVDLIVSKLKEHWSKTPVVVLGSDTRGGFDPGDGLSHPVIRAVEGEPDKPRRGRTPIKSLPGLTEILVYKVGKVPTEQGVDKKFGDSETHVTIDIYNGQSKVRMDACYKEAQRVMYKLHCTIGGNYHRLRVGDDTDLTNRAAGLWRTTLEVYLIKIADYIAHA